MTGSPPGAVGLQLLASMGFYPTKNKPLLSPQQKIMSHVRIDPKKKEEQQV
jgi:hypothetical protein